LDALLHHLPGKARAGNSVNAFFVPLASLPASHDHIRPQKRNVARPEIFISARFTYR
jgi:hypothetical protein